MKQRRAAEAAARRAVAARLLGAGGVTPLELSRVFGQRLGKDVAPFAWQDAPTAPPPASTYPQESDDAAARLLQRIADLERDKAALETRLAELSAQPPERVEVEKVIYHRVLGDGEQMVYEPRGKGKAVPFSADSRATYPRWWLEEVLGQVKKPWARGEGVARGGSQPHSSPSCQDVPDIRCYSTGYKAGGWGGIRTHERG